MKDDNKLKEEDIKKVSGGNGGLIKKDDKDRPGWHCCECGHWYGDVDFSGFMKILEKNFVQNVERLQELII